MSAKRRIKLFLNQSLVILLAFQLSFFQLFSLITPALITAQVNQLPQIILSNGQLAIDSAAGDNYQLYYQSQNQLQSVKGELVESAQIFFGTCSDNNCVADEVSRLVLKVSQADQIQTYQYQVTDQLNLINEYQSQTLDLEADERLWLESSAWTEADQIFTLDQVELFHVYTAPQNDQLTITFTQLPENPGSLSIQAIQLSEAQVVELGALSSTAYEITSTMEDGTFTYDLTLPNPQPEQEVKVQYSEDGNTFIEVPFVKEDAVVKLVGLDHFTVFVVTSPMLMGGACTYDGCYESIQSAIDNSDAGTEIYVDTSYDSTKDTFPILVDMSVKLYGAQRNVDPRPSVGGRSGGETVIDGDGSQIMIIDADNVEINGFEFVDGDDYMIEQKNTHSNFVFKNNIVHDQNGDDAVKVRTCTSGCYVSRNYIYDVASPGDGIGFSGATDGFITDNELTNISSDNAAIYVYSSTDTTIDGNLLYNIFNNDGIKLGSKNGSDKYGVGGLISNNIIHDVAQDGLAIYMSNTTVSNNEVYQSSSQNGAIYLAYELSNVSLTGNKVFNNPLSGIDSSGIKIGVDVNVATVLVNDNSIYNNSNYGLRNYSPSLLDATNNWWGHNSGPLDSWSGDGSIPDTNAGSGNAVRGAVEYGAWTEDAKAVVSITKPGLGDYVSGLFDFSIHATDDFGITAYNMILRDTANNNLVTCPKNVDLTGSPLEITDTCQLDSTLYSDGEYILKTAVKDTAGQWKTITQSVFFDNTRPSGQITTPADGSVHNSNINVTGVVSDGGSAIDYVEVRIRNYPGNTYRTAWQNATLDGSGNFSATVDITGVPDDNYEVVVVAYDNAGNNKWLSPRPVITLDTLAPAVPTSFSTYQGHGAAAENEIGCGVYTNTPQVSFKWFLNSEPDIAGYWFGTKFNDHHQYFVHPNNVKNANMTPGNNPYFYTVIAVDAAGNESVPSSQCELILDQEVPVSTISEPSEATYFNSPITISGNTTDNYGVDLVTLAAAPYADRTCGTYTDFMTLDNGSNNTDYDWTYDWTPSNEGSFCIKAYGTDVAGNIESSAVVTNITYDISAAVIEWDAPADGSIHNSSVLLEAHANEIMNNFRFRWMLSGDVWVHSPNQTDQKTAYDYLFDPAVDGVYQLRAQGRDLAINWSRADDIEITIDRTRPTGSIDTPLDGSFHQNSVGVTGVVTDSLSGIDYVQVRLRNYPGNTYRTDWVVTSPDGSGNYSFSLDTSTIPEDVYEVAVVAYDNAGNNKWLAPRPVITIDRTDPSSSFTHPVDAVGPNNSVSLNDWDGVISGEATDDASPIKAVWLSIQKGNGEYWDDVNGVWTAGETLFEADWTTTWTYDFLANLILHGLDDEGDIPEDSYQVTSHAEDMAGNIENTTELEIIVDRTIPEVILTVDPTDPDGDDSWYKTRPTVTLTASDDHDVAEIQYQWNSQTGSWTTYAGSFQIPSEGIHVLYYRAIDLASNPSDTGIKTLKWDETGLTEGPLNVSVSPNPTSGTTATVKWEAAKDDILISKYEIIWSLDGTSTQHSKTVSSSVFETEINELVEGIWTIKVKAFDGSGHSKEASTKLTVDRSAPEAPVLTLTGVGAGTASLSWNEVVDATEYLIFYGLVSGDYIYGANVGNVTSYTVQGLGAGDYYFIVRAKDSADNQSPNSNEVSTGTIAGALGVEPGTPAEGFQPAGEVQGVTTDEDQPAATGEVMGESDELGWWMFNLPWIILVIQAGLVLLIDHLQKQKTGLTKQLLIGLVTLIAVGSFYLFVNPANYIDATLMSWLAKWFVGVSLIVSLLLQAFNYAFIEEVTT